jgi:plastocyanin
MRTPFAIAAATLLAGALALPLPQAAAAPTPAPSPGLVVHIKNFMFMPMTATVKAGTTIEFINDDDDAHTVTLTDRSVDSGGIDGHDTWSHTFTKTGTFNYICAVHPYMKGVLKVLPR